MEKDKIININLSVLFRPRKLIVIDDNGARYFHISSGFQIFCVVFVIFFVAFTFYHIGRYSKTNKTIAEKDKELYKISRANNNLSLDIKQTLDNLQKFNTYLTLAKQCDSKFYEKIEAINKHQYSPVTLTKSILKTEDIKEIQDALRQNTNESDRLITERVSKLTNIIKYLKYPVDIYTYSNQNDNISIKTENLIKLESAISRLPLGLPMNAKYISSQYGARFHPTLGRVNIHNGIDLVGKKGSLVYATAPGVVQYADFHSTYGKYIKIYHSKNISTSYAHLSKIFVKKGDRVKRGELIGIQGRTGRATGEHLHYEVRLNESPNNPYYFMKASDFLN